MRYGNATRYNGRWPLAAGRWPLAAGRWPLALLVTLALTALAMLLLVPPAAAQNVDYDADDDSLIDITTLAQLKAIDFDRDGDGLQGSETVPNWAMHTAAFPNSASTMGCPAAGCTGYELLADLDFDTDGSGTVTTGDEYPDGFRIVNYNATLRGNGHTIANHKFHNSVSFSWGSRGFFDNIGSSGRIHGLALVNMDVRNTYGLSADPSFGGLVGVNNGRITGVYVTGSVTTVANPGGDVNLGGLVGRNNGFIGASYNAASVEMTGTASTSPHMGGLVGWNTGTVNAAYSTGAITTVRGNRLGGLVGSNFGGSARVRASYSLGRVSRTYTLIGVVGGAVGATVSGAQAQNVYHDSQRSGQGGGYTGSQLKQPTDYSGIYADWNVDIDGDTMTDDDPWDFGTRRQYPALKVDFDNDGTATPYEFGRQGRPNPNAPPPAPPPYNPAHDHPEIYQNARHQMATACEVRTTGTGDEAKSTSTLTFDLGSYTRPLTLALSLWDGTHFRSLQSQGIAMPELRREGRRATVEVVTDPAQTRFRLDSEYGLNLVLGYADCHTDDP